MPASQRSGVDRRNLTFAVIPLVLLMGAGVGCTEIGAPAQQQSMPSAAATMYRSGAADSVEIESLELSFTLPPSFVVEDAAELVFLARSSTPPAILTIDDATEAVVNHQPRGDESLARVDIGAVDAIVVNNASVEGLPPGVAARELLVANGSRSFTVIMSAAEVDLPQLWDQFLATVAAGEG